MNKLVYLNIYFTFLFLLIVPLWLSAQRIPMTYTGGVYTIPCEVNGLKLNPILDTGASSVSISLTEALFMLRNGYLNSKDILGTEYYRIANGDIVEGTKIILRKVKVGDRYVYNVEASVVHTLDAPLLLGQSVLSRLGEFTVDYSSKTLIISSGNNSSYSTNNYTANSPSHSNNNNYKNGTDSWTLEECKLRSRPSAIGDVITFISKGRSIKILDSAEAGYYRVWYNGTTGYINKSYVRINDKTKSRNTTFRSSTKNNQQKINSLTDKINQKISQGRIEDAESEVLELLSLEYDNRTTLIAANMYEKKHQIAQKQNNSNSASIFFEKAETYYNQAIQNDKNYFDAQYSLGALYFNATTSMRVEMNRLPLNEVQRYEELNRNVTSLMDKALPYFLAADRLNSNDYNTVFALKEIYARRGDSYTSDRYNRRLSRLGR